MTLVEHKFWQDTQVPDYRIIPLDYGRFQVQWWNHYINQWKPAGGGSYREEYDTFDEAVAGLNRKKREK